jgi:hypothetical protein
MQQVNDYPIPAIQWAQQQLSQYGRIGCTRLIKFPDLAAAVAVAVGTTPTDSAPPLLTWRDNGTVIGLYGQERAGTVAKFAATEFRLQFTGDVDFVSNGSAGVFAPLLSVVGPNVNWFAITRRVQRGDNWALTWRNFDTAAVANPAMLFSFIADVDLGSLEADYRQHQQRR